MGSKETTDFVDLDEDVLELYASDDEILNFDPPKGELVQNLEEDVLELHASDDEMLLVAEPSKESKTEIPKVIPKPLFSDVCNTPEEEENVICSTCFHVGHRARKCRCTYFEAKELEDEKAIEAAKKELKRVFRNPQRRNSSDRKCCTEGTRNRQLPKAAEKIHHAKPSKKKGTNESAKCGEVKILASRNMRSWN